MSEFSAKGWVKFTHDPEVERWAEAANKAANAALVDPALAHWHQCGGTWFVGVDALPNDASGAVGGVPLGLSISDKVKALAGTWPAMHRAQLSVIYEGYPKPREGESEAGFRYRLNRDAAHVDGVLGLGHPKRRFVKEPHAFILGIPLNDGPPEAAPMVVWEGSHLIMQRAFAAAFQGMAPQGWSNVDVTEIYVAARREVFETCPRVVVHARLGEAYLVHPLALHGVAPWGGPAVALGRRIAYFRPQVADVADWIA